MLVLTRKIGEAIIIDKKTRVVILEAPDPRHPNEYKIGIDAPREISVHREEVQERIDNGEPRRDKRHV